MARILIVDDQAPMCFLLSEFLAPFGHEMLQANSADEGLEIFNDGHLDMVITDVHMPGRSGIDLLQDIRAQSSLIPVIIVTGKASLEAAVECLKYGASDFLTKPIDFTKLRAVVSACLEAATQSNTMVMPGNPNMRVISGYRIKRTLGTGTCGVVYLAEKEFDGELRQVALKILQDGLPDEARDRFVREAEIIARFSHENIVKIWDFDVNEDAQIPYIAMEFIAGRSLKQEMERSRWDYRGKGELVRQIALALDTIHEHGVCHRDVKPHNVMINEDGMVKLADFGIVRTFDSTLTSQGCLLGTPAYMAPESFGKNPVDHRSDLFSLGTLAYQLFTSELPFSGNSVTALAFAICTEKPLSPRRFDPQFPIPLENILARLMKKNASERYQHGSQVAEDLACYLKGSSPVHCGDSGSTDDDWE